MIPRKEMGETEIWDNEAFTNIPKVNGVYFLIWLEYYKKYQWMSGDGSVQTSYSLGDLK